jgi:[ribosomal protein S5]-alanine N-acetyltransferase
MFQLTTNRLILRPFEKEDASHLFELNNDPKVIRYTGDIPFETVKHAEDFILNYDQYEKYRMGRFSVLEKTENTFFGWCGLKYSPKFDEVDLGFRFIRKHWNQGFASEASEASLKYGFQDLKLDKVVGRAMIENIASIKVLEKVGMKFKKEFDFDGYKGVIYSISRQHFFQLHSKDDQ